MLEEFIRMLLLGVRHGVGSFREGWGYREERTLAPPLFTNYTYSCAFINLATEEISL
jgi:hypothetical protein